MASNKSFIVGIILALLLLAGGFAVFGLVKLGFSLLLAKIGIVSEAMQYIAIIIVVLIALSLTGLGFRKAIKKLLN